MYSWERAYQRTWDVLRESISDQTDVNAASATFQSFVDNQELNARREKRAALLAQQRRLQLRAKQGVLRQLLVVLDASKAMDECDYRPTRRVVAAECLLWFSNEFFDQNPISQLGVLASFKGLAHKMSELSAHPEDHMEALKNFSASEKLTGPFAEQHVYSSSAFGGEFSLQNILEMARAQVAHVSSHGSREILVIAGSLTSCDPGNIFDTIQRLKEDGIRCSIIGLAAEVHVCKIACKETGGTYSVAMNSDHLKKLLATHLLPPSTLLPNQTMPTFSSASLIKMGFPQFHRTSMALCACHSQLKTTAYSCPRCQSRVCHIPIDCPVCHLTLVSSPHLARSYHHLLPVTMFEEVKNVDANCFSCQKKQEATENSSSNWQCTLCKSVFCEDCDVFIHDILHTCPGCCVNTKEVEM